MALNQYVPGLFGLLFAATKSTEQKQYPETRILCNSSTENAFVKIGKLTGIRPKRKILCIKWQMTTLQQTDQIIDFAKWIPNCDLFPPSSSYSLSCVCV